MLRRRCTEALQPRLWACIDNRLARRSTTGVASVAFERLIETAQVNLISNIAVGMTKLKVIKFSDILVW